MIARRMPLAIACGLLAIANGGVAREAAPRGETDWRKAATVADRARLRRWRAAWIEALATARANGIDASIAADPVLFDPDRALTGAGVPEGDYRCRTMRLGMTSGGAPRAATWTPCVVTQTGDVTAFEIVGTPRIIGSLYDGGGTRLIFLGSVGFGDERRVMRYGRDATRDMAGVVERIAAKRWRLVLPYPHFGGTLDLVEIVPQG